jgi:transcriptional regulator with XRE-family HTH domain
LTQLAAYDIVKIMEVSMNGKEIKQKRTALGWSREKMGRMTELSAGTIANIENGTAEPRPATLTVIRSAFDLADQN